MRCKFLKTLLTVKLSIFFKTLFICLMIVNCTPKPTELVNNCVFCQIVCEPKKHYVIWESSEYMAFLSIYPNTDGVTVVIPKNHYPSHVGMVDDEVLKGLILAAKTVQKILQDALPSVGRVGFVIEGLGVNHLHMKLFPLHGTSDPNKIFRSKINTYNATYGGYITTHNYYEYPEEKLKALHKKILSYQK